MNKFLETGEIVFIYRPEYENGNTFSETVTNLRRRNFSGKSSHLAS